MRSKQAGFFLFVVIFFTFFPIFTQAKPAERVDVIIELKSPITLNDRVMMRGDGARIRHSFWIIDALAISIPETALQRLANHPKVKRIVDDSKVPVILGQTVPWGVARVFGNEEQVSLETTWTASNGGESIKVAVLDTGIDSSHPDLDIAGGWNFVVEWWQQPNDQWQDLHGHGTHVAGIIAAKDNGVGVVGIAPEVDLYAFRVADENGYAQPSHILRAIEEAVTRGMNIINMSLGNLPYDPSMEGAVNNAYNLHNVLVVAAAGNEGQQNSVHYPAKYDGAIAVAASSLTEYGDERAYYSDRGPEVELIAPGTGILSTVPNGALDDPFADPNNPAVVSSIKNYAYMSGTSMSTPHVTGVAALIWSQNPSLLNNEVRDILSDTAEDLGRPAYEQGAGLVRADRAVAGERFTVMPRSATRVYRQFGHQAQQYAITARYLDDMGQPVEHVEVTFEVISGPNEGEEDTGSETDAHGEVSWAYAGTGGGGVDTILVTFVLDSQVNPPQTVELKTICHWITGWDLIELDAPHTHQNPLIAKTLNTVENEFGAWSAQVAAQDAQGSALLWGESNYLTLLPPPNVSTNHIYLNSLNSVPDNILTVGSADSSPTRAWYWLPDHIEAVELPFLSELDPEMWGARAKNVNNKGWIAGSSSNQSGDLQAVIWWPDFEFDLNGGEHLYDNPPINLGYGTGSTIQMTRAEAINENGVAVGAGKNSSGYWHAYRSDLSGRVPSGWNDMGTASPLPLHQSLAFDGNIHNALVGSSQILSPSGAWRAMYKKPESNMNSGWINLGVLSGSTNASEARSINDSGLIVGYSMWPSRAFVTATPQGNFQGFSEQPMYDLNEYTRVSTGSGHQHLPVSEWTLLEARSINSQNHILAMAQFKNRATPRAVLLKPRYE